MTQILLTLVIIVSSSIATASGQIHFELNDTENMSLDHQFFLQVTERVTNILPPAMVRKLPQRIHFELKDMGTFPQATSGICAQFDDQYSANPSTGPVVAGILHKKSLTISINSDLFIKAQETTPSAEDFPCFHFNYYRTLVATIAHELGHIYSLRSPNLSSSPEFLNVINYHSSGKSKSVDTYRAPDAYVNTNSEEAWATYLEYFLLEPDFQCRLPVKFKYYKALFQFQPFKKRECGANNIVVSQTGTQFHEISARTIGSVDYLLVGARLSFQSLFGHTMLRLNLCSETSIQAGYPNGCRDDKAQDVALSVAANVTDFSLDMIKGLFGGYHSLVFIEHDMATIRRYNYSEGRDVRAYPISMTWDQKQRLADKILDNYWSYRGNYKFITNNCATETFDILSYALNNGAPLGEEILTPKGLRRSLKTAEHLNSKIETFGSTKKRVKTSFKRLVRKFYGIMESALPKEPVGHQDDPYPYVAVTYDKFCKMLSAKKRMGVYQKILGKSSSYIHDILSIEQSIYFDLVTSQEKEQEEDRFNNILTEYNNTTDRFLKRTFDGIESYGIPHLKANLDLEKERAAYFAETKELSAQAFSTTDPIKETLRNKLILTQLKIQELRKLSQ